MSMTELKVRRSPVEPVREVFLAPGYPGASFYRVTASTPEMWVKALRTLVNLTGWSEGEEPWHGVIVAGAPRGFDERTRIRSDWSYWTGISFLEGFTPHGPEHPHVFRSLRAACMRTQALNGLPTILVYEPCFWVRPDTYQDLTKGVFARLRGLGFVVRD
jgi:hypothetical protein